MKINNHHHFYPLIIFLIIALVAGYLGAWSYLGLLNKYKPSYSVNELIANQDSELIIRDAKKVIVEQDNKVIETVNSIERTLAGIFLINQAEVYDLTQSLDQVTIITSDGWLLTNFNFANLGLSQISTNYIIITNDKQLYHIDQIIRDEVSGFVFVHVANARDLPVSRFARASQLQSGQLVVGVNWHGPVWLANISQVNDQAHQSSEMGIKSISLTSQPSQGLIIADLSGNIIGLINKQEVKSANYFIAAINDLLTNIDSIKIDQAYLGLDFQNLNLTVGYEAKHGALITKIIPGSPAALAGLQLGDVITAIDGMILNGGDDLAEIILDYEPQEIITVSYLRDAKQASLEVELGGK